MVELHPEYVKNQNGDAKAVLLSIAEWEKVMSELEELDDIRAYDQAKAVSDESVPFDQAVREIREDYNA